MGWLSKRKFVIVYHEKVVSILLEGDEILRVHGERTQGVVKTLMNTKTKEEHEVHLKLLLELLRKEKLYAKFSKCEMVANALSRKEWVKPRRVREMAMTIQSGVKEMILERIEKTKRSKNDQKPTRNERDKNKSEETARNQKPDQPDTARKAVKGVTCENKAKRRNSRAKTKTFEEYCYLLLYAVSKEDTAYLRRLITRIRVMINSRFVCMTWSSTKELLSPFENPERVLRSRRKLFKTPSLVESNSPEFEQISEIEEHIKEEEDTEIMAETMEQYMSKTHGGFRSGVARPTIDAETQFELKGQFLKELRDNTFSGSEHEDANEHIEKVLEIVDLFHVLKITQDQLMLRAFPVSLTGATSRWLRNEPDGQSQPGKS
ncbi:hypothetical protein Tco_0560686 [Tanacetum coccineum]